MKKHEIKVGGLYTARVKNKHTTVRVDLIRPNDIGGTYYNVTDMSTGITTMFRSAAAFHSEVKQEGEQCDSFTSAPIAVAQSAPEKIVTATTQDLPTVEGEQRADPTGGHASKETTENAQTDYADATVIDQIDTLPLEPLGHRGPHDQGEARELMPEMFVGGEYSADPTESGDAATTRVVSSAMVLESTNHHMDQIGCAKTVVDSTKQETAPFQKANSLAAKIAAQSAKPRVPAMVAGYIPTDEQRAILEAILQILDGNGPKVLVVNAGAGSGKTSLLRMAEEVLHGTIQYCAYNRPLVDESRKKFKKAKCSTGHGLAFGPVGSNYKHRLNGERIRSKEVARMLGIESQVYEMADHSIVKDSPEWVEAAQNAGYGESGSRGAEPPTDWQPKKLKTIEAWQLAGYVSQALKKFSQTADSEIGAKHFTYVSGIDDVDAETGRRGYKNNDHLTQYLLPFARKFWDDVCDVNGTLPFIHDYYVKMWQLQPDAIIPANHVLLDEHQDTAPVFADVIQRQSATVVLVGDECQRIYDWRGAMNAADLFPDAPVLFLSQSFRFGQSVADVANSVLHGLDQPTKLNMKGLATIPSRVLLDLPTDEFGNVTASDRESEHVGKVCYLYRTNAGAIGRLLTEFDRGRRGCLIGKVDEVVKFVRGAQDLQSRPPRRTDHPELAAFENWKEVQEYVEEDPDGKDLKLMVDLIDKFTCKSILQALNDMPEERDADFVCGTAHKSKGREWDTVVLGADFPPAFKMVDSDCYLLYVAATRARLVLDLTTCTPFHPYKDKDGNEYPAIEVNYTVPVLSKEDLMFYLAAKNGPKTAPTPSQSGNGQSADPTPATASQANVATANGNGNARPPATEFTWTQFSGKWVVRGPLDAKVGDKVKVVKKSGASSNETIRNIVRKFDDACIYEV